MVSKQPGTGTVSAILAMEAFDASDALARISKSAEGAGAIVSFQGVMRPETKAGEPLDRLVLEWHPRMTEISLRRIAEAGADRFATRAVAVVHRCGDILPGETIVLVAVASDHRRDAFLAADYIMDRLKTDAVFWKREVGTFGSRWIEPTQRDQQDRTRWNNDQGQD
ncbi:molybdenum cofactor biosynthesis protein MoaE [Hyphomonas sp. BRH_c22]|uniref:molybdenum cofactor biosynthesis protein MoaE n=1 Tax=Hyphomonas sp. BRH_c22 TaxID=1629710 RepID=UPI000A5E1F0B|nr:molybdenum cofactor biosynthesis protein MoaE [Hyphomonas sp. BRH_c22]